MNIPESGFYKIAFRVKQNFNRGMYSSRKIYIDGKVPFKEVESYGFKYANKWYTEVLSGDEPYLFYLEKGTL